MINSKQDEKAQVLKMVEEGKITSAEGMELLNALDEKAVKSTGKPQWLKVRVKGEGEKSKVKVNLPLSLVDIGLKISSGFVPELKNAGISEATVSEILQAVKNGEDGKIVEVEDEENKTTIEVFVE